ncbi:MAG: hypothetical protein A2293_05900 [Elusimicrobia bacterium RIFOXYB2_FULL_49_7]|nr:MAG: hypothetical protein A2293_05900 [Elusimicrobia bacterium RIFOXYB2_FULL_49_7]
MNMKPLTIILGVALALQLAQAQDYGLPGDYLLELYPSARALAMGGGSVAACDNSDALFLNPGALGQLTYSEFAALYQRMFEGLHYYTSAFAYPMGRMGVLGMGVIGTTSPEIPEIDSWGIKHGTYRTGDNSVLLSYGRKLGRFGSVGGSLKMATQTVDTYSGMGVGFDVGGVCLPLPWLSLGAALFNLGGPTLRLNKTDESFTTAFRSGAALHLMKERLTLYGDIDILDLLATQDDYSGTASYPIRWRSGVTFSPFPYLALSAGVNDRMITGGLGFTVRNISADYGLGYHRDGSDLNLGFTHAFSLRFPFGKPVPQIEEDLAQKTREVESRRNLQEGQQLYIRGFHGEARKLISTYVSAHPEDKNAAALLAEVEGKLASGEVDHLVTSAEKEMGKRNYAEADNLLSQAISLLPSHEKANQLKQKLLMLSGNAERVEHIKSLYAKNKYEEMAKELDVVLSLDSTDAGALEYRSKISAFLNQREADKHYNAASKCYYEEKNTEKANTELQQALALKPDHKEALVLYEKISGEVKALYLKKVGQMVDAKGLSVDNQDLKKLIQLDVQDRLVNTRKLLDAGQIAPALAEVDAILRENPDNTEAKTLKAKGLAFQEADKAMMLYNEALKLLNDNKLADAEAKAAEALQHDAGNQKAKGLLDDIRLKQRRENLDAAEKKMASGKREDLESARKMVEDYIAVDSENERAQKLLKDIQTDLYVSDANLLIDKGEYEKADQMIQKALQANPDNKKAQDAFKNLREAMDALQ